MQIQDVLIVYEEAIELAKQHNKKEGDDIGEEFFEIMKQKNLSADYLGCAENIDADLLSGNLRENGIYVRNLNEELRKQPGEK